MRDKWYIDEIEKPPKEKEDYMITDDCGNIQIAHWTNLSFFGVETTLWHWTGLIQYTHVIAWRPLPEPYKGSD